MTSGSTVTQHISPVSQYNLNWELSKLLLFCNSELEPIEV